MRKQKKTATTRQAKANSHKLPLIEHIYELRRRLFYVAASVAVGSIAAYSIQQQIVHVLLRPAHGQNFIYTSPLGGMNFLFGVCIDIGIVLSLPIIVYNVLKFIEPLMHNTTARFVMLGSVASGLFALAGMAFGYFFGLPAALEFLMHQFTSAQVKPLLTIQAYLSFVSVYMLGAAMMFQLPLFIIFINRIKPLKPSSLFKYERHMIVAAFVIGFIMNPTPNIIDQLLVVFPIILSYQVGIGIIWVINRRRPKPTQLELDARKQAERDAKVQALQPLISERTSLTNAETEFQRAVPRRGTYIDGPRAPQRREFVQRAPQQLISDISRPTPPSTQMSEAA